MLAEHREESGEERSCETGIQDRLNMDDRAWGARPLRECRNVAAESGVVNLVNEDAEESSGFFVWIRLELGVDLNDEGGSDGGE